MGIEIFPYICPNRIKELDMKGESMDNFAEKLMNDIQNKMVSDIAKCQFVDVNYQDRVKVSRDLIIKAYSTIDTERIINRVRDAVEDQIAKTIINSIMTETATDTKQLMSNNETRQQLKYRVYPEIMKILEGR